MATRNYFPPSELTLRQDRNPQIDHHRIAVNHREIQSLLSDNQRLVAIHFDLRNELSAAEQELRHLSSAAGRVKVERDAEVREAYEKAMKMKAEVRLIDELKAELAQVLGDIKKLLSEKEELVEVLARVRRQVREARSKGYDVLLIKEEIDAMLKEIERGRAAVECEKKAHASNLEESKAMEKFRLSMAGEIEKLKAELTDAEKRSRAAAAAAAISGYTDSGMTYGGNAYPGPYGGHQVQGRVDLQFHPGAVVRGSAAS